MCTPGFDLSKLPAAPLPAGVVPNFTNPYTRGPLFVDLCAVALGFVYLFVAVRFYSKLSIHRRVTWNDLTCILVAVRLGFHLCALYPAAGILLTKPTGYQLGTTAIFVGAVFAEKAGAGRHQWNYPPARWLRILSSYQPLYILLNLVPLTSIFAKLSFYIFYLQVFDMKPTLKWCIYLRAMVTSVFYIATTVATFVLSTPAPGRPFYWQFMTTARKFFKLALVIGYFNIASDLYILLLPISGVIRLQLPMRRKVGVILIFMTASLACIANSVALFYRYRMSDSGDSTWNLRSATYTTQVALTIGIACSIYACLCKIGPPPPTTILQAKSYLNSRVCIFSFRHESSSRGSLGNRRVLSLGPSKSSLDHLDGEEVVTIGKLPKISKGMHHMRTDRSFIWGGRKHHTTIATLDEEDGGIYYNRDFQRPLKKA